MASPRRTARYERIPPDGFDMAALENHCPQASPRGDVGIAPTFSFLSTGFLNRKYGSTCPCQKQTRPDRNTCQGGFCGIRTVLPVPLQPVYFFLRLQPATIAAASAMPAGMMTTGNASPVFGVEEIFVLLLLLEEDEPELLLMTVVVWLPPAAVVVPEPSLPAVVPVPLSPVTVVVPLKPWSWWKRTGCARRCRRWYSSQ